MKWFFRITAIIIVSFAVLVTIGYVASPDLVVEEDIVIESISEDVFPYLENLSFSNEWSPWHARQPNANYIFSGPDEGVGAHAIWRDENATGDNDEVSSQKIIAAQPSEFIQSELQFGNIEAKATYAIISDDADNVIVYIKYEQNLGAFPYIQRLLKTRHEKVLAREFQEALQRLKAIVESKADSS